MTNTVLNICSYLLMSATKMKQRFPVSYKFIKLYSSLFTRKLVAINKLSNHCQKQVSLAAAWKHHVHRACDVATKQPGLKSGRLCSVGSLPAATVLWSTVWHCGTAVAGIVVDEWRALSQRFIDRCINEQRRRLKGVVQQNGGHIEHLLR